MFQVIFASQELNHPVGGDSAPWKNIGSSLEVGLSMKYVSNHHLVNIHEYTNQNGTPTPSFQVIGPQRYAKTYNRWDRSQFPGFNPSIHIYFCSNGQWSFLFFPPENPEPLEKKSGSFGTSKETQLCQRHRFFHLFSCVKKNSTWDLKDWEKHPVSGTTNLGVSPATSRS